jgi:hypothetical protein
MGIPAMKKSVLPATALFAFIFVLSLFSPSAVFAQNKGKSTGNKTDTYLVIKITDENKPENNRVEYRVVSASQYTDEEKRVKDEYKKKVDEWLDLKKADATAVRPVKPIIKKIGTSFKTQGGAQKVADKLKADELDNGGAAPKPKDDKR